MSSDMKGRVCLITGASSGIGKVTALELAKMGATAVLVCRNKESGERAKSEIIQAAGNGAVDLMLCDLSSQRQVRSLASEFKGRYRKLHVLVNNAATVPQHRTITEDGLETQLAVNHLAPFLLTHLLLDVLRKSAPSRIINVSSGMYRTASLDFDDLQGEKSYRPMKMYAKTKLLNIYFTYELARRLEGTGVTVNCLAPGFTATGLGRDFSPISRFVMKTFAHKKEIGAQTSIYLASSPEVERVTGKYFERMKETQTSPPTYDKDIARRVWEVSEQLTGLPHS
jgi:NAD(P)-dependent dehydrogenase (short-subunit alcohol dehydrogenase family)